MLGGGYGMNVKTTNSERCLDINSPSKLLPFIRARWEIIYMTKYKEKELERYKATQAYRLELVRATNAFEHAALKPPFILNGGALVVVMALLGAIWKDNGQFVKKRVGRNEHRELRRMPSVDRWIMRFALIHPTHNKQAMGCRDSRCKLRRGLRLLLTPPVGASRAPELKPGKCASTCSSPSRVVQRPASCAAPGLSEARRAPARRAGEATGCPFFW